MTSGHGEERGVGKDRPNELTEESLSSLVLDRFHIRVLEGGTASDGVTPCPREGSLLDVLLLELALEFGRLSAPPDMSVD